MSGIPAWAVRGAKVVCVNSGDLADYNGFICNPLGNVQIGVIYTIRAVLRCSGKRRRGSGPCLLLQEVRRPRRRIGFLRWYESPFLIGRFRPAQENGGALEIETALFHKKRKARAAKPVEKASV